MSLIEIILILAFVLASIWFIYNQKAIFKYFYEKITGEKLKGLEEKKNEYLQVKGGNHNE